MNQPNSQIFEQLQIEEKLNHLNKKKKIKRAKKWLLDIDSFGHQVKLGFENHLVHKTYLGSFLTIILCALVVVLIYVSLNDIINKKNPTILRSEMLISQLDNSLELPLDFTIAVVFQDILTGENFNPDGIFKLTVQNQIHQNIKTDSINIPLVTCTSDHFTQNTLNLFQKDLDEGKILCIEDPRLIQRLKMYGQMGDDYYNNILFRVDVCDYNNLTSPYKCKYSQQETEKIINQSKVKVYFTDFLFNPNDYSIPYSIFKKSVQQVLQSDHSSYYDLFFTETYIITDSGYITTEYTKQKYPSYYKMNRYTETRDTLKNDPLFLLQSSVESKGVTYERSYQKIQVFLGTIGGFMKALFSIFFFISAPFVKLSLKTEIVNRIFNFSDRNENENQEEKKKLLNQDHAIKAQKKIEQKEFNTGNHNDDCSIRNNYLQNNHNMNFHNQNMQMSNQTQIKINDNSLEQKKQLNSFIDHSKGLMTPKVRGDRCSLTQFNMKQQPFSNLNIDQSKQQKNKENEETTLKIESERKLPFRKQRRSTTKLIHNFFKTAVVNKEQKEEDSPINLDVQTKEKVKDDKKETEQIIKSEQKASKQYLKKTEEDLNKHQEEDIDSIFRKLFKSNESILKMKCIDYIYYFLNKITFGCFKFTKKQQIKYSMKKVGERMDIIFILKKLIEVDKMKMLLLNDDQRKIFDYLPRPVVNLNKKQSIWRRKSSTATDINQSLFDKRSSNLYEQWNNMFLQQDVGYFQKCVQAYFAFQNIKEKSHKDVIDKRLLDFMDPHKKKFFNTDHICEDESISVVIPQNHHNTLLTEQSNARPRKRSYSVNQLTSQKCIYIPENISLHTSSEESRIPNENIYDISLSQDLQRKFKFHTFVTPIATTKNSQKICFN